MFVAPSLLLALAGAVPIGRPPVEAPLPAAVAAERAVAGWEGVYATPAEIGGFTGTVLALKAERWLLGRPSLDYRMTFYSDVVSAEDVREPEKHGNCLTDGDALYLPTAFGRRGKDDEVRLSAHVERYTRVRLNGREILMRDDALRAYRAGNRLYDTAYSSRSPTRLAEASTSIRSNILR